MTSFAARRPDVFCFETEILTDDTTCWRNISALQVATTGTDALGSKSY
jgi:hypothetical protein